MKVIIAGDYCPQNRVTKAIEEENFGFILGDVQKVLKESDYSIVNLECPVINQEVAPIEKHGPNMCCSKLAVKSLKWAGVNCVTLANNHFLDYGTEGVRDTIETCKEEGLDYVGGGLDLQEAARTLFVDIEGIYFSIVNCCEHEFSIATETSAGSNPLNVVQQFYAIQQAKTISDYVIVIVHGGVEHFWLPNSRMKETYRFFIDAGADAVINHHQHCYSGYEIYNSKPIFYGLGNFCFDRDKDNENWSTGFIVILNLTKEGISFDLLPYKQCFQNDIGVRFLTKKEANVFYDNIKQYNDIIANDILNNQMYVQWCRDREYSYKLVLNPFYNSYTKRFFEGSFCKKLFRNRWIHAKNMIDNESHVERLKMTINNMIK